MERKTLAMIVWTAALSASGLLDVAGFAQDFGPRDEAAAAVECPSGSTADENGNCVSRTIDMGETSIQGELARPSGELVRVVGPSYEGCNAITRDLDHMTDTQQDSAMAAWRKCIRKEAGDPEEQLSGPTPPPPPTVVPQTTVAAPPTKSTEPPGKKLRFMGLGVGTHGDLSPTAHAAYFSPLVAIYREHTPTKDGGHIVRDMDLHLDGGMMNRHDDPSTPTGGMSVSFDVEQQWGLFNLGQSCRAAAGGAIHGKAYVYLPDSLVGGELGGGPEFQGGLICDLERVTTAVTAIGGADIGFKDANRGFAEPYVGARLRGVNEFGVGTVEVTGIASPINLTDLQPAAQVLASADVRFGEHFFFGVYAGARVNELLQKDLPAEFVPYGYDATYTLGLRAGGAL